MAFPLVLELAVAQLEGEQVSVEYESTTVLGVNFNHYTSPILWLTLQGTLTNSSKAC